MRESVEQLGLGQLIPDNLKDEHRGKNTQLPLSDSLRQSIYSRLAAYEDLNDAERLSQDPAFLWMGSKKIRDRGAALPSHLHWFQTQVLTQAKNLSGLAAMNREMAANAEGQDRSSRAVLAGRSFSSGISKKFTKEAARSSRARGPRAAKERKTCAPS